MKKVFLILSAAFCFALPCAAEEPAPAIETPIPLPTAISEEEDQKIRQDLFSLLQRTNKIKPADVPALEEDFMQLMITMERYIEAISPEDTPLEAQIAKDAAQLKSADFQKKYQKLSDELQALRTRNAPFTEYTADQRSFAGAIFKINLTSTQATWEMVKKAMAPKK